MNKIKVALIGAGQRGAQSYAPYALKHPDEIEFTAVAEPDAVRRESFRKTYHVPEGNCYENWEELLGQKKLADAVMICTQDRDHVKPALKALEKGYHILLEKPVSYSEEECDALGKAAEGYDKVFLVCHVLRYTPFFQAVKKILDSGAIGELQNIQWLENVGYWHQAHSYVRGNWRNSETSSPMILAKCCHDLDLLLWLADSPCKSVSSFGSLGHFNKENAPENAPERCLDGCPAKDTCPYYAPHIYIDWKDDWQADVIRKVVSEDTSEEALMKALKEGPYGRCVYHCDNNVVDHQVVNMEFENGVTASLTMTGFSYDCSREVKFMGSKGELRGALESNELHYINFRKGIRETIPVDAAAEGHGGGDSGIMESFLEMIRKNEMTKESSDIRVSIQSHKIAFAAERSRVTGKVISL